ncbi:phosphate metabolism protein [Histoplasma ohiense]|nr:phosphate metabolism protein [Histoplasma ohiense (nom. inval.)]
MSSPSNSDSVAAALDAQSGTGQKTAGMSITTFLASLATALIVFTAEVLLFTLLKGKLTRIYQPRTYLVSERERTNPSPPGLFRWIAPVFRTSNSEFIQKCGLDAYFFLRYLRMLLKIFVPLSFIILPVLIPLNKVGGKDTRAVSVTDDTPYNVSGLDQLAWGNIAPEHTDRYWAHLVLAVVVVVYVCAVFFDELRGYIRLRQTYLTSPQHRLRASATTVLVTAIPSKWLSVDALDRLFDVFPGGVRNIWINRNMDELSEKVKLRNKLALKLESAETELIKKCKKAQLKQVKAQAKKSGKKSSEVDREKMAAEQRASRLAQGPGISSGDPHEAHTIREVLHGRMRESNAAQDGRGNGSFIPRVGDGVGAVGSGVARIGKTVLGGFRKAGDTAEGRFRTTGGFDGEVGNNTGSIPNDRVVEEASSEFRNEKPAVGLRREGTTAANPQGADVQHQGRANPNLDLEGDETRLSGETHMEEGPPAMDGPADQPSRPAKLKLWKSSKQTNPKPNPQDDQYPLTELSPVTPSGKNKIALRLKRHAPAKEGDRVAGQEYPLAYNEEFEEDDYGDPLWMKYIKQKDRETMRLPIFGWTWMPAIPLLGKKVDKIYHCRQEVARLNLEIEVDQRNPEKFPLMNSAFVQFNHQVAAHMACQSVSHHIPKQMAPRLVEISPDDVIWDNMSIKWWERYLRTFGVLVIVTAMVIGWAFPVAFTGLLSQLAYLEGKFPWLRWISSMPDWLISAVQGILPPLFLAILMAILPLILRFLSRNQGVHTGMAVELTVQNYYFAFLFVQIFLVVSISSGFTTIFNSITDVTSIPQLLAQNIPRASNYFFSYMVLQAMSVSAGALVQIFALVSWFILAPILDNTARMKWARTTNLNQMQWGTFFPVYTTLASIGLIYCVISPLIMVFNVLTFGLFWFVYRYNTLYVTKFRFDTGGLLFPKAINQLFTGIYVMEICLIGMFFLVRDSKGNVACEGQAICMIVVAILTVGFQYLLNEAFNPLFRYLPITLEDDACRRDDEFARTQRRKLGLVEEEDEEESDQDNDSAFNQGERLDEQGDIRLDRIERRKARKGTMTRQIGKLIPGKSKRISWADRSKNGRSKYFGGRSDTTLPTVQRMREKLAHDAESQAPSTRAIGQALFSGIHDELEDLTPDERDRLVQRAFQHEALRMKRPVIWIPRDDIGVSDDEVFRTQRFSKHIWISNEYQALDGRCRAIFSRSPPDFSEVDLIQL